MFPEGIEFSVNWLFFKDGKCPTLDYLVSLSGSDADCFGAVVDQMSKLSKSENIRFPVVRPLKGRARGSFELHVMAGSGRHYARLPLVYSMRREIIILFGQTGSRGDLPPPGFIDRVVQYRKMINNGEATHGPINFKQFN